MPTDNHAFQPDTAFAPARKCFVITPGEAELSVVPKALRAPSDGTITLRAVDSNADVVHPVFAGEVVFVRALIVRATTCTGTIIGYA